MTSRKTDQQLGQQLDRVRRALRERHAGIEPDAQFAARVLARLPRNEAWSLLWAARRVLPVSIALALVLIVAIVATGRVADKTTSSMAVSASSPNGNDPLEWLLEGRQELR